MTQQSKIIVVVLGDEDILSLPKFANVTDLPKDTDIVLVCRGSTHFSQVSQLSRDLPLVRFVAWIKEGDASAIRQAIEIGFSDVLVTEQQLQKRLDHLSSEITFLNDYAARMAFHAGLVDIIQSFAASPDLQDVLRVAVMRLAELFDIERVSVILFQPGDEIAFVVMVHEKQLLDNLVIRISDYPEIQEIIQTQKPLVIQDVFGEELLSGIRHRLQGARDPHQTAVLFPLTRKNVVAGAMFLRSKERVKVPERLLAMGHLIASLTSVAIGSALEYDALLSEQRNLLRKKDEQLRSLGQLNETLGQVADGVVVTDTTSTIRYANPAAAAIFRLEPDFLLGKKLIDLLCDESHEIAKKLYSGAIDNSGYQDLLIPRPTEQRVLSASIRRIADPEGVIISFRDVTEVRETESELQQTKEFLENLIQSSVDAIIAADIKGRIILFNRAAEQMLGYSARETVGILSVEAIYPEGEAKELMRHLRSEAHGGRGRLETSRKDLVAKNGELVPVNLTAAIIYEGPQEIATVGLFTDLRDKLRMEEKLLQVQQKLKTSERQAIAVELAGAAAHELNQPLTSILGYAEMLKRKLMGQDAYSKPINTICSETERMAGIVKKIGQITSYETKTYVGHSQILKLDSENSLETESKKT